ncbi:MAG TPA: hypothetical protein VGF79_00775 [Bacteroidia bacterium]
MNKNIIKHEELFPETEPIVTLMHTFTDVLNDFEKAILALESIRDGKEPISTANETLNEINIKKYL